MRLSMLKKLLTLLVFALFSSVGLYAQVTVSGTVIDAETGETVPGVNILIVELQRGAASDSDGNYEIRNIDAGTYTVRATFVGYNTFTGTLQVGSQDVDYDISLEANIVGLDELVVSGYSVVSKRELTGSISSVSASDIENVSLQNTQSLLQGRAAGVTVTATSGNPGAAFRVNIRGNGSINAATEPLYIVDGVQIATEQTSNLTSTTPLNAINPNDIESIEVLKDAAAAAIYGSQAAAGVVIITTKKGVRGQTRVNANIERGVRSLARTVDYISSEEYVQFLGEGRAFDNDASLDQDISAFVDNRRTFLLDFFGSDPNGDGTTLANTNWQDFIFEDGVTERYNLSLSGGNERTTYFLSSGYEDTEGTAFNTDFTRLNLRTNIDHKINDKFTASVKVNVSNSTQFGVCQDGNFINCPPSQAMFEAPMSFPFLADGNYNNNTRFGLANNPAVVRDEVDRNVDITQVLSTVDLLYLVNDWLSVKGSASVDYRNTQDEQFRSAIAAPGQSGWVSFVNRNVQNVQGNLVANARKTFDDVHNVTGLVGTEYRRVYSEFAATRGEGFSVPFFSVLSSTATPASATGNNSEWRIASYFTNLKYDYDGKYFLSFTGRYDGSSRFGSGNRWAFFPSISGAWRVSEESFFNFSFVDDFKIRAGYGTTGNSAIGNFAARNLYGNVGSYDGLNGITPTQLANENLSWEEAQEINVGFDYELFASKIFGSIDIYRKDNKDLLFGRPLPSDSGFDEITENIGSVRNEGIEIEINSRNVTTSDFSWTSRFNVAFVRNEILELPEGNDIDANDQFEALIIGKQIGLIQVPEWAGVNPADGRPMWYDANGEITYTPGAEDNVEWNDGIANTVGGFGNTLNYKGFSLDAFFQFSLGQWAFASSDYYFTRTPDFLMNLNTEVRDRWRLPGDVTYFPRAMSGGNAYPETDNYRTEEGTQSIYNASYIRLKNVSLSYNLPTSLLDGLGIRNVRLYASAINMVTWTAWPWYDPEVAFDPTDIFTNVTSASYPTERQVYGGIDISF